MTPDHLSSNALTQYAICQVQWYLVKKLGPRPPGIALHVGGAVHTGAEVAMREKAVTHEDKRPDDVRDAAVAKLDSRLGAEDVLLTAEEESIGRDLVIGRTRDRVAALAHYWACTAQSEYQPVSGDSIEQHWSLWLPAAGIELIGITDLVAQTGVVDWKTTGGRKISQNIADTSLALTCYALAHEKATGNPLGDVRLDVLQEKKKGTNRYVLRSTRTRRDYEALLARINTTLASMKAGNFTPCNPGEWWCSERFCGFFATGECPHVNPSRRAAAEE